MHSSDVASTLPATSIRGEAQESPSPSLTIESMSTQPPTSSSANPTSSPHTQSPRSLSPTTTELPQSTASSVRSQVVSKPRDGRTKVYYQGYAFTRANATVVKITYRCSSYRKNCRAQFAYYADSASFDFGNMEPHTCRAILGLVGSETGSGDHCIDVSEAVMDEVDKLAAKTTMTQKEIWTGIVQKFYMLDGPPVRGVSKQVVENRVQNARGTRAGGPTSLIEKPPLSKVKGSHQGFFQFQYSWHDAIKAQKDPVGIDRIIGWGHPALLSLLCFENLSWYIDGTFRCAPNHYKQCVTIMVYDQSSKLYVPVVHVLTTSMTKKSYLKLLQCVQDSVGSKLVPKDVVCDFEGALIGAMCAFFPDIRIIGCLFHFKQACSRKLKRYGIPKLEAKVAMSPSVFDVLTVIDPSKIAVQGIAWVKAKIRKTCETKQLVYSRQKWRIFWAYFQRTWMDTFPPTFWNVYGINRDIVSRTNNPLERFHRELNKRFRPHPSMKQFATTLEILAREYVLQRNAIISGIAVPPVRVRFELPRAPRLPSVAAIEDSASSSDSEGQVDDVDVNSDPYSTDVSSTSEENAVLEEADADYEQDNSFEYEGVV